MKVQIELLNLVLKKLHVDSPQFLSGIFQTKALCEAEQWILWNASWCTSLLMCSTHFTLSGIILCVLPTSNSFVQFMFTKIPGEFAWVVLCRQPWCWLLVWQYIRTQLIWILDLWYLGTAATCRKFLYIIAYLYLVFCIQKWIEGCTV